MTKLAAYAQTMRAKHADMDPAYQTQITVPTPNYLMGGIGAAGIGAGAGMAYQHWPEAQPHLAKAYGALSDLYKGIDPMKLRTGAALGSALGLGTYLYANS